MRIEGRAARGPHAPADWRYRRGRITKDESRALTLAALEDLTRDPLSGGGPKRVLDIVDRFYRLESRARGGEAPRPDPHAVEVRVRRSLRVLEEEGRVEWVKGKGFLLSRDRSAESAIDDIIRRLRWVQQALRLPPSRRGTWPESSWTYALRSIVDAIPVVEQGLRLQLGRDLREPTSVSENRVDPLNPFPFVTLRGSTTSLPGEFRAWAADNYSATLDLLDRERCRTCLQPLPHEGKHVQLHSAITERLVLVRGFDPQGHAHHPPCGVACSAFWTLDYLRLSMGPETPDWVPTLPPAPGAPLAPLDVRPTEIQTPSPPRASRAPRRLGKPAGRAAQALRSRRAS